MTILKSLILMCFLCFLDCSGQITIHKTDSLNIIKEKDFTGESSFEPWMIKTDIVQIVLGDFPILIEKRVNRNLSFELGVFYTFSDWMYEAYYYENYYKWDTELKPSFGGQFEIRYHIEHVYGNSDAFVGLRYYYKHLQREYLELQPGMVNTNLTDNIQRLMIVMGFNVFKGNSFAFEPCAAIGAQYVLVNGPLPNGEPPVYPTFFGESNGITFCFVLGLRIGTRL